MNSHESSHGSIPLEVSSLHGAGAPGARRQMLGSSVSFGWSILDEPSADDLMKCLHLLLYREDIVKMYKYVTMDVFCMAKRPNANSLQQDTRGVLLRLGQVIAFQHLLISALLSKPQT